MIRELARQFSTFGQFVDGVIIELTFRRGNFSDGAQVVKAHSSMALLRSSSAEAEILIKLIRPRHKVTAAVGCRIQSSEKTWRVFTSTEIFAFVEAVGDLNPIHRMNPPIVPALLILETLLSEEFSHIDDHFKSGGTILSTDSFPKCRRESTGLAHIDGMKLKFRNFVTADEPLSLFGYGRFFELVGAGERKVTVEIL